MVRVYDSAEEAFDNFIIALEGWSERWAEAGSGWVLSGGEPQDAYVFAYQEAGPKPRREDFLPLHPSGSDLLPPPVFQSVVDDDIPF
jgi:hypothetical protein